MVDHDTQPRKRHCMVVFAQYPVGETRVQREAEALIERGIDVDVICLRGSDAGSSAAAEIVNNARVYRVPAGRSYGKTGLAGQMLEYLIFFWHAMISVTGLHLRRRYHVVQVHNLPDFLVFAAWLPRLLGARIILDLHDLMPEFLASKTGRDMDSWLVRLLILQEQLSCRFADQVITVTNLWRETLMKRGVPPAKVSVVMNVADDRIFNRAGKVTPIRTDSSLRMFYHGIIAPRAGLDVAIEALARLHVEFPDLVFTIHGRDGQHSKYLAELALRLHVDDRVIFSRELIPLSDLPQLIVKSDVGLVPYRRDIFMDGVLPTKLMEYTALGLPTIVARTSAVEAYFDDTMVEFFRPEDVEDLAAAIRRLASDRQRRRELSRQSDLFNHRFNWAKQGEHYAALVEGLGRPKERYGDPRAA